MPASMVPAAALGLSGARSWLLHGELPPAPRLAIVGSRAASRSLLVGVPAAKDALGAARDRERNEAVRASLDEAIDALSDG